MSALIDHMWQSLQVIGCLALFAFLTRRNSARFRVWLWRAAIWKLLVPLQLLYLLGTWWVFPVSHSANPPPVELVTLMHASAPVFAPARHLDDGARWALFGSLLLAIGALVRPLRGAHDREAQLAAEELRRLDVDPDDRPAGVGLINAAIMTAAGLTLVLAPVLAGGLDERLRRQVILRQNTEALRDAAVVLKPAAPGFGSRLRVSADAQGVTIRNATLQEIGGLAYGVSVYLVRGQHFGSEGGEDWLIGSRHDVRVAGPVIEPQDFDTYALREPLTQALAKQFGLEIYQNGKCQPPCGRWGSLVRPAAP